jgi:5-methylcytosine-specific restriction protein A
MSRNTGPTAAVRQQVIERDHGLCARCRFQGNQIHHRRPRGLGGSTDPMINNVANLIFVCSPCHLAIELHRERSYAQGWLLKHTPELPSEVALLDRTGRLFFLTEEGDVIVVVKS